MNDREAFEAWFKKSFGMSPLWNDYDSRHRNRAADISWQAWIASAAAERERCAKVCETLRDTISDPLVIGEGAHNAGHNALQSAADAIRKGE